MNAIELPWRRVLAAGAFAALAASTAAAQCQFPANPPPPAETTETETTRIRGLLDQCRAHGAGVSLGQQLFFTWGHRIKLEWLLNEPVIESCAYNRERERSRAVYRLAHLHGERYLALRAAVEALLLLQPPPRNLREIRDRVLPPEQATAAELAELRELAMIVFAYPEFGEVVNRDLAARRLELDARLGADRKRRLIVDEAVSRADAIGGLERRLGSESGLSAAERRDIERRIEGHRQVRELNLETLAQTEALDPLEEARILGELVTLDALLDGSDDPGMRFQGSSSYGYGVYLSTRPLEWIQHFYTSEHAGLVCDFRNGGAPQLDVVDWRLQADLDALTRYPGTGTEGPAMGVLVPGGAQDMALGGTNLYIHPAAFEAASHARLLAVRTGEQSLIYVDRCAIDYRGGACRWFRVTDLTCEEATTLSRDAAQLRLMQAFFDDTDPEGELLDELNERCHSALALY